MCHPDSLSEMQDFFYPDVKKVVKDDFQLQPSLGWSWLKNTALLKIMPPFRADYIQWLSNEGYRGLAFLSLTQNNSEAILTSKFPGQALSPRSGLHHGFVSHSVQQFLVTWFRVYFLGTNYRQVPNPEDRVRGHILYKESEKPWLCKEYKGIVVNQEAMQSGFFWKWFSECWVPQMSKISQNILRLTFFF